MDRLCTELGERMSDCQINNEATKLGLERTTTDMEAYAVSFGTPFRLNALVTLTCELVAFLFVSIALPLGCLMMIEL